jgi:hypothetical protein
MYSTLLAKCYAFTQMMSFEVDNGVLGLEQDIYLNILKFLYLS